MNGFPIGPISYEQSVQIFLSILSIEYAVFKHVLQKPEKS